MQAVSLDKASRLLNHGPTVLVVVIDKAHLTRELVDASGVLSVCLLESWRKP